MLVTVQKAKRLTERQRSVVRRRGDGARNPEQRRQWESAARHEPAFRQAFNRLMRELFTPEMERETLRALRQPNATMLTILEAIPFFNPDDPGTFAVWNAFAAKLHSAYTSVIDAASQDEIRRRGWEGKVKLDIAKIAGPKSVLPTLPVNPVSADYIRKKSLSRAVQMSADMKDTVASILADAFDEGLHPTAVIEEIKSTVGLTPKMRAMVQRRVNAMRAAGFPRDAVNLERDKFADAMRYRRAEAIARTETLDAHTQGLKDTWATAAEEGLMPPGTKKKWISTNDERTSDICVLLDGDEVGVDEQFDGPDGPLDGPPAHPNCRSTMILVFPEV